MRTGPGRGAAVASLAMLAVFAVWTAAFIAISGWMAGGDVPYLRAWLPWLGATLAWTLPLLAGVMLGAVAIRHGGGRLARLGLVLNAALLVILVLPNLIGRLVGP
ncbi:MAG: hypothetical protein ACYCVZ_18520 [Streptosporangiaceae bacterium]